MVGPEHYCRTHHGWTCSAAPIHGLNGEVIGCFNMSGDASGVHDHTLAVVLAAVYGIEGKLSLLHNAEIMHSALESSADGIVLLSQDDYRAIWMNSAARRLLGLGLEELQGRDFRRLMPDIGWDAMDWRRGSAVLRTTLASSPGTGCCTAPSRSRPRWSTTRAPSASRSKSRPTSSTPSTRSAATAPYTPSRTSTPATPA